MTKLTYKDLLDAGVHFGHLTRKWDPRMAPYIFMERNGIHIIDLNKTLATLDEASNAIRAIVRSGRKVLFVATKKQAKSIVEEEAKRLRMPYVTERWLGGMLTNFTTIRKSLKKLSSIEKLMKDESYLNLAKRERLMVTREKDKLAKVLGGISELTRLPAAVFVVDVRKEHIAVKEAQKLNIPIFAMVDTNSNPNVADFPIPANDDAYKSIDIVVKNLTKSVEEGLLERKKDKDDLRLQQEEDEKRQMDEGTKPETEAGAGEKPAARERRVRLAKVEEKSEPKTEVKAEPKTEVKAEPKTEVKAEPKTEVKTEPKTEAKKDPAKSPKKSEEVAEAKVEEKPEAKTKQKPEKKAEETVEATEEAEKK
jgi:small subunit ribosomal protein S2